jgi:hypothetical protein
MVSKIQNESICLVGVFGPLNFWYIFASGNRDAVIVKGLWFRVTFPLRHDGGKSDSDFLIVHI